MVQEWLLLQADVDLTDWPPRVPNKPHGENEE